MDGKTKNIRQRSNFFWGGEVGSGVRDVALLSLRNLGAKFSEMSFPHFTTTFYANQLSSSLDNNLLHSIPITLLCLQYSLSKMHDPEKEKLCIL